MMEVIEIDTDVDAIPNVRFSVDLTMLLKSVYEADLVNELRKRGWNGWVGEATDTEIKEEFEDRDLKTSKLTLSGASDEQLFQELELRGFFIFGEEAIEKAGNLIDKINQKRATIEEIYTLLETITGKLICR
jgi:hypothetical protein